MPLLGCTHHFDSIAFCGGCAKGAFQIGAWAALEAGRPHEKDIQKSKNMV